MTAQNFVELKNNLIYDALPLFHLFSDFIHKSCLSAVACKKNEAQQKGEHGF